MSVKRLDENVNDRDATFSARIITLCFVDWKSVDLRGVAYRARPAATRPLFDIPTPNPHLKTHKTKTKGHKPMANRTATFDTVEGSSRSKYSRIRLRHHKELHRSDREELLQTDHLSPRDRRLHDPGRRSDGRAAADRATRSRMNSTKISSHRAGAVVDGQCRTETVDRSSFVTLAATPWLDNKHAMFGK